MTASPTRKETRMTKRTKYIVGGLVGLTLIGALAGGGETETPVTEPISEAPVPVEVDVLTAADVVDAAITAKDQARFCRLIVQLNASQAYAAFHEGVGADDIEGVPTREVFAELKARCS